MRRYFSFAVLAAVVAAMSGIFLVVAGRDTPAEAGTLPAGSVFVAVSPYRLFDSRGSGARVAADASFDVAVSGTGNAGETVPSDAVAVVFNLTYVDATGPGYVTAWPAGSARPNVSNLNKVGAGPVPNLVTVKLGTAGKISVYNQGSDTHLFGDVAGYYVLGGSGGQGPVGPQGPIGQTGLKGDTGAQGAQGEPGPQGDPGWIPGRLAHTTSLVASPNGIFRSATIGVDGLPLVVSTGADETSVRVTHCDDPQCLTSTEGFAAAGNALWGVSIAVGVDGLGLIAYIDNEHGDVKMGRCTTTACTSIASTTIDTGGVTGQATSIAIGTDGRPLVAYVDEANAALKVAQCTTLACTSAGVSTIATPSDGSFASIMVGLDGRGLVSYHDSATNGLKVAHCDDAACLTATITDADTGNVGSFSSITLGADGLGVIAYRDETNAALNVAHCTNVACSGVNVTTIDSVGDVGRFASIAIGSDGLPVIGYVDDTANKLKVAHCSDVACSAATLTTLTDTNAAFFTSITIGTDGLPVVAYRGGEAEYVVHCSNVFCLPYTGRR